jgi:hypothetical protein
MSQPTKYRKKPVVIEAMQVVDDLNNHRAIAQWITDNGGQASLPFLEPYLVIKTLEGDMRADLGDYVIRGVQGEFYPCKPDIFAATYELAAGAAA